MNTALRDHRHPRLNPAAIAGVARHRLSRPCRPRIVADEMISSQESQRDSIIQPRVARNELPWVTSPQNPLPHRGCIVARPNDSTLAGYIHLVRFPRVGALR